MGRRASVIPCVLSAVCCLLVMGCATPQYALRPSPVPNESANVVQMEQAISRAQAKIFDRQQALPVHPEERPWGFDVVGIVNKLSSVTERANLRYRVLIYRSRDQNAAALADGRIYISSGMMSYLSGRESPIDELVFVVAHELAHTVAQHLVKRYQTLKQQQLLMAVVSAGASAVGKGSSGGQMVVDAASLINDIAISGFSQEQELEADQLGVRYMLRAGYDPRYALNLLHDFAKSEQSFSFLRSHPYAAERRAQLMRYLTDTRVLRYTPQNELAGPETTAMRLRHLREAQSLYPEGSTSWINLQHQIEALERGLSK